MSRQQVENTLTKPPQSILTSTSTTHKLNNKKVNNTFDGRYVEYKIERNKKSSITEYLEKIR